MGIVMQLERQFWIVCNRGRCFYRRNRLVFFVKTISGRCLKFSRNIAMTMERGNGFKDVYEIFDCWQEKHIFAVRFLHGNCLAFDFVLLSTIPFSRARRIDNLISDYYDDITRLTLYDQKSTPSSIPDLVMIRFVILSYRSPKTKRFSRVLFVACN